MTIPLERTRAVIQTREFLERLERDPSQSEGIRSAATQLLRHYPSKGEVLLQGHIQESLGALYGYNPFFSSSIG
ncbi:TPA: BPSL0761 family protein [Pseudomonas aeruginosa]|uniref:BPSL0761 family protein n=1 Tax=Pseudomonas TaxID=286 RepID=UPI000938A482|nr:MULTISPECIES: BPSL0761 family protein [Pseudomonas]MCO1925073.1 hypothetical protein [Pseudomonas aeruginosa]MCO1937518.1 hypothetical protein [Pseudomonas aeruginosa]MDO7888480.1 BPSL0761 family protein [Pseudomonas aeruginosa]MDO7914208.1 BPSL0761 family protein [Pseudomonas aeruginosa]PBW71230.1 hypothetical protein CJU01_32325 [Pseudomonas aeruginosa]